MSKDCGPRRVLHMRVTAVPRGHVARTLDVEYVSYYRQTSLIFVKLLSPRVIYQILFCLFFD